MSHRSAIRWLLLGGLVPLWGLFAGAGRATASCGDYLHILPATAAGDPAGERPAPVPCPCQGPACRQGPAHPAPGPVTSVPPAPADALFVVPTVTDPPGSAATGTEPAPTPAFLPIHVFRPPRG